MKMKEVNMKMKKKLERILVLVLSLAMIIIMMPTFSSTVYAGNTAISTITPGGNQQTLYNGYTYNVQYTTSIYNLRVASGATAVLYIPAGVVLYCYGSSGSATTGGKAGIYLPSNSTLVVTGGGVLYAYGGSGGSASSGSSGGGVWAYVAGCGGSGGYGGGGAGAGIGTDGGSGGSGGSGTSYLYGSSSTTGLSGYYGNSGYSGSSSSSMGYLYVLGNVSVNAYGGNMNYARGSGAGAGGAYEYKVNGWWKGITGGAGGGGGGAGGSGNAIGSGGPGGGGGGGGASGAIAHWKNGNSAFLGAGGGGGGAGISGYGGYGGYGSSYYSSSGSSFKYSGGYGSSAGSSPGSGGSGNSFYTGYEYAYSYSGGSGGYTGNYGSSGYLYKSSTSYVNARGASAIVSNHSAVNYALTLDKQNGTGGTSSVTAIYGTTVPNISVPTRDQYAFMGYYTGQNGTGTRYYNQQGYGQVTWTRSSNTTLYAYWVQQQFNITLNQQGGSKGTTSFITTGTDGTLLNSIDIPTREHYVFEGYYGEVNGEGTQYYNSDGTITDTSNKLPKNTTLYASWTQNQWSVTFNQQGGSDGAANIWSDAALADKVDVPTRTGYTFNGYYTAASGATQYYNHQGNKTGSAANISANLALYAQWEAATYTITYEGIENANNQDNLTSHIYDTDMIIIDPTKTDYTFMGWSINGSAKRYKALTLTKDTEAYAQDITLKANWLKTSETEVIEDTKISGLVKNKEAIQQQLQDVFNTTVDNEKTNTGITTAEANTAAGITIKLTVKEDDNTDNQALINSAAAGSSLAYYDITATKVITDENGNVTSTTLEEIPSHIEVAIPLTGDLAGQTAYSVYRVHNGEVQVLSPDTGTNAEYYSIEEVDSVPCVVIRTRKFSTYAVIGSSQTYTPTAEEFSGNAKKELSGFDVQGRVIEPEPDKVYKLDVSWGTMKYNFVTSDKWDTDMHLYTEGSANAWKADGFDGTNNKISTMNHSNAAVIVNYAITNKIEGFNNVVMKLHQENGDTYEEAINHELEAAPVDSKDEDLKTYNAYLWLNGTPQKDWIKDHNSTTTSYDHVATILVTVNTLDD